MRREALVGVMEKEKLKGAELLLPNFYFTLNSIGSMSEDLGLFRQPRPEHVGIVAVIPVRNTTFILG